MESKSIKNNCSVKTTARIKYYVDEHSGSATVSAYGDTMTLDMKRVWPSNFASHNKKFTKKISAGAGSSCSLQVDKYKGIGWLT